MCFHGRCSLRRYSHQVKMLFLIYTDIAFDTIGCYLAVHLECIYRSLFTYKQIRQPSDEEFSWWLLPDWYSPMLQIIIVYLFYPHPTPTSLDSCLLSPSNQYVYCGTFALPAVLMVASHVALMGLLIRAKCCQNVPTDGRRLSVPNKQVLRPRPWLTTYRGWACHCRHKLRLGHIWWMVP